MPADPASDWFPLADGLTVKVDLANGPSRIAVTVFDGKLYACEAIPPGERTRDEWAATIGAAAARCVETLSRAERTRG